MTRPLAAPQRVATKVQRPNAQLLDLESKRLRSGLTEAEKAALASIYANLEAEATRLNQHDIDRLAEERGEGRTIPGRRTNFHE